MDAKAYFVDGSDKTITITKLDKSNYNGVGTVSSKLSNKMYTYVIKDGNYELKTLKDSNKAGYKEYSDTAATYDEGDEKISGYAIADDTVVFVKDKNNNVKVTSGKTVKDWTVDFGTSGQVLASEINGIKYVKVAALISTSDERPSASGDYKYAYLTEDVVKGQTPDEDEDDVLVFTVFGEDGAKTLYDTDESDNDTIAAYEKGMVIRYTEDGDKVKNIVTTGIKTVAITGVEDKNKGYVYFLDSTTDTDGKSISLKLDEDAYFVKIDDADTSAEAGARAGIVNAHSKSTDHLTANAYIAVENDKIVAVYYDVDKLDDGVEFVDHN